MSYHLPQDQKQNILQNLLFGLRSTVTQREFDVIILTAQGKTDEAQAAQSDIDNAKAAIDALVALDA